MRIEISVQIHFVSGPVVMNMSGYSEKGFKRKLAVQALFGKVFYLSEVNFQSINPLDLPLSILHLLLKPAKARWN